MLRGYRLALVALGGLALALASAPGQTPPKKPPAPSEQRANEAEPLPVTIPGGVQLKDTPAAEQREREREQREKEDLAAQRDMARFAMWQAILGGLSLALVGATVFYARRAAHVAEEALRGLERPYLFFVPGILSGQVEQMVGEQTFSDTWERARFELAGRFENHGRVPCVIRRIELRFLFSHALPNDRAHEDTGVFEYPNLIVPPGKPIPMAWSPITPAELACRLGRDGELPVLVVGRIVYDDVQGQRFLRGFCFRRQRPHGEIQEEGGGEYNFDRRDTGTRPKEITMTFMGNEMTVSSRRVWLRMRFIELRIRLRRFFRRVTKRGD